MNYKVALTAINDPNDYHYARNNNKKKKKKKRKKKKKKMQTISTI
jgi:hypothetical protein